MVVLSGKMSSFLVCDPDSLDADQHQHDANVIRALMRQLHKLACSLHTLPSLEFSHHLHQVRSLAVVYDKKYISCPYRGSSTALLSSWLGYHNYSKQRMRSFYLQHGPLSYQGDDVHIMDECAYLGHGIHTDYALIQQLADTLKISVRPLHIIDHRFRSLIEVFCPLDAGTCLAYLPAFDLDTQKQLQREFTVLAPSIYEVDKGVCNAVVVGDNVMIPSECPDTELLLTQHGYNVTAIAVDHDHYRKRRNGLGHYLLAM